MMPLFFGDPQTPLYGVHHAPQEAPRDAGVVLCYPFGQEYMRAHRAYRQLALLLTRKGFHVLRFDYRGCGNSSGDMSGVDASEWVDDIRTAVTELRDLTGVDRISVVGLRLGGLLAALACDSEIGVDRLVLWDPVLSGACYERELQLEIAAEKPSEYAAHSGNGETVDGTLFYNGFALPPRFRRGMREMDLLRVSQVPVNEILQVVSHESDAFNQLRRSWDRFKEYRYQLTPAPHDWNFVDNFGGILLPQPVIQAIVGWLDHS